MNKTIERALRFWRSNLLMRLEEAKLLGMSMDAAFNIEAELNDIEILLDPNVMLEDIPEDEKGLDDGLTQ